MELRAKELRSSGDAAGVWNFLVAYRGAAWNFPRKNRGLTECVEFRGFPDMELGIFIRVAKILRWGPTPRAERSKLDVASDTPVRCITWNVAQEGNSPRQAPMQRTGGGYVLAYGKY